MFTVNLLHPTHELIRARAEARTAADRGIQEMLVVIRGGQVVECHPPPGGFEAFASDESWIANAIRNAHESGVQDGRGGGANDIAPKGWVLWYQLQPGVIATTDPRGDSGGLVAVGHARDAFGTHEAGCNAMHFGGDTRPYAFFYQPTQRAPIWPFYRVLKDGLSDQRLRFVVENFDSEDDSCDATQQIERLLAAQLDALASAALVKNVRLGGGL